MRLIVIIASLVGCFMAVTVNADVWEFRRDGSTVFHQTLDYTQRNRMNSDWKPPTAAVLRARRANYDPVVREIAEGQGIDPLLVHALIEVESGYDRAAVSKAGAVGLMQLMKPTAERFGVMDREDARANIRGGVKYLAYLDSLFPQQMEYVIAAYHAGEHRVAPCLVKNADTDYANCERKSPRIPNIPETQRHVGLVMEAFARRQQAADRVRATPALSVINAAGGTE